MTLSIGAINIDMTIPDMVIYEERKSILPEKKKDEIVMKCYHKSYAPLLILILLFSLLMVPISLAHAASNPSLSAQDFQRLEALITSRMQAWHIPGMAISVVQGDHMVYSHGFGNADTDGRAITPQTPFILASVSKSFTATATMQLVEQGKIVLDAPIKHYLPWLQFSGATLASSITVRQLLSHTSGISAATSFGSSVIMGQTLEQQVRSRTIMLDRPVGSSFEYANFNYQILGLLVQVVSGEPFDQYIQRHIFEPLGMHHSFTSLRDAMQNRLAQANTWAFGFPTPLPTPPLSTADDPSGNLISSADDLSQYMIAEMNGGRVGAATLLSASSITTMQTPLVHMGGEGERMGYGMGWFTGEYEQARQGTIIQGVWHGGTVIGYNSMLFLQPEQHWGVAMLFNINNLLINTLPFDPSEMLKNGVIQFLSGLTPTFYAGPSMQTFYIFADIAIGIATLIVLWPLFRLPRWQRDFRKRQGKQSMSWWRWLRLGVRLSWEVLVPLTVFLVPAFLFHIPFQTVPLILLFEVSDFGGWLFVMLIIIFTTGVLRSFLIFRVLHIPQKPTQISVSS